jgi:hypothetical protein
VNANPVRRECYPLWRAGDRLKTLGKVGLVAGGYVLAAALAGVVVAVHAAATANDSRGADGMYAFGDVLLFLFVFGSLALIPSALAFYFIYVRRSKTAVR